MNKSFKTVITTTGFLANLLISHNVSYAGGFEKTVQWSAKNSAIGGAAASSVNGADALYFNPAGLVDNQSGKKAEISANFSPTVGQFEGPVVQNDKSKTSSKTVKTPFALLGQYKVNDNVGIGTGVYSAGGTAAVFKGVDYSPLNPNFGQISPWIKSSVSIVEYSLGVGFKANKNFNFGAAWRVTAVEADLESVLTQDLSGLNGSPISLVHVKMSDIKALKASGYRLGAQYLSDSKNFGFGLMYRSAIKFAGKGKASGDVLTSTERSAIRETDITLRNQFPQQVEFATHYKVIPESTLFAGYSWTQYSKNRQLDIDGNLRFSLGGTPQTRAITPVVQDWYDQHSFRFGIEDRHLTDWALRLAYVNTSQVTNENAARATFSSPGHAHTFVAGAGTQFLNKDMDLDLAAEYSFAKGRGKTTDTPPLHGDFSSKAIALHSSVKYRF